MVHANNDFHEKLHDQIGKSEKCLECGIQFSSAEFLLEHLHRHHIKQPRVVLVRHTLSPIKLTIKGTKDEGFRIVPSRSPALPADSAGSQTTVDVNGPYCPDAIIMQDTEFPTIDDPAIETDGTLSTTEETNECQDTHVPGGEPTPPPDTPELPKIRIKAGLIQPQPSAVTRKSSTDMILEEIRTPLENESLSSLFTNNDRAKDLGFTTSDPDYSSQDMSIQPFSSASTALLNNNPLASISNMQELANQVSRLQPANGMHQQNVLINIQQFQPPQPQPPVPHSYPPMYPPPQPAPPMYQHSVSGHMQYQYPSGGQVYYPQAPPPVYAPGPQQMQPPCPSAMQQSMMRHPAPRGSSPQNYMRSPGPGPPHQQQGQQQAARGVHQMRPRGGGGPRAPRAPILRQTLNSVPTSSAPWLNTRPQQRGPPPPNVTVKRRQLAPSGPPKSVTSIVKKMRIDTLVPDKNDDADCEVVAVTQKSSSLPQIQSIQGNVSEPANCSLQIPDTITVTTIQKEVQKDARPETNDVANVLASRGITVTAGPRQKDHTSPPPANAAAGTNAVSINLNSSVCIIPQKKKDGATTVDLTDEIPDQSKTSPTESSMRPPPLPAHSQQGGPSTFECHLCTAKFHTSALLVKHRTVYHRTNVGPDFGIPLIDLKSPGITKRLTNMGIFHYIPLPNSNSSGMFALPILSANSTKAGNSHELASSILTLGPIKPISPPRPVVRRGRNWE